MARGLRRILEKQQYKLNDEPHMQSILKISALSSQLSALSSQLSV